MRTLLVSILFLAQAAFGASMGDGYSNYYNATADETHLYLTTTTEGSDTSCYQFFGLRCQQAQHQGMAYAQIGGVSQTATGGYVSPGSYIQLQAAVTLSNPVNNQDYLEQSQSQVTCTIAGTVFLVTVTFNASIRKLQAHIQYRGPVPPDVPREFYPRYKFSPVSPECSNTTTPAVNPNFVVAANHYDEAFDVVAKCPSIFGVNWCIYPIDGGGMDANTEYIVDPGPRQCDPGP